MVLLLFHVYLFLTSTLRENSFLKTGIPWLDPHILCSHLRWLPLYPLYIDCCILSVLMSSWPNWFFMPCRNWGSENHPDWDLKNTKCRVFEETSWRCIEKSYGYLHESDRAGLVNAWGFHFYHGAVSWGSQITGGWTFRSVLTSHPYSLSTPAQFFPPAFRLSCQDGNLTQTPWPHTLPYPWPEHPEICLQEMFIHHPNPSWNAPKPL